MPEELLVRDFMTANAMTIASTARLLDAALLMRRSGLRHLPVVDGDRLVGVITDRDVQRCAPSRLIPINEDDYNAVFENTTVERVMCREPKTIALTALLSEAIAVFQQARVGCLPVLEKDKVVGILTRWDLIEALSRVLAEHSAGKPALARR